MSFQHVCVLGATGSIGISTLDVIARHPYRMAVYAVSGHTRMELLAEQARDSAARVVLVPDEAARSRFLAAWQGGALPEIRVGAQALVDTAADPQVTTVMAAIIGAAGLPSALAAARAGKRVLLANKEALVAAGRIFMQAVQEGGAQLMPIDSEHSAIYQCLAGELPPEPGRPVAALRRLLVTASGGPFRSRSLSELDGVTPEQACAHPNWSMGRKISVDSATMLNKGLEVIEAHWLFSVPVDQIDVVVHPQSVIHSMVEYIDGSVMAQLGQPDMRTAIAYGLGFPERLYSGVGLLDLATMGRLDFEQPDFLRFPCLRLAYDALRSSQAACVTLNAANEIAVDRFLERQIGYTQIPAVIEHCLDKLNGRASQALDALDGVLELDSETRSLALDYCRSSARI